MEQTFKENNVPLVTGGTDNHLLLLDLSKYHFSGKDLQTELDKYNITGNKNCIPNDKRSPKETSGFRVGSAAMVTRGAIPNMFWEIAQLICYMINSLEAEASSEKNKQYEYKMKFLQLLRDYDKDISPLLIKVEDIGKTAEAVEFWKSQL